MADLSPATPLRGGGAGLSTVTLLVATSGGPKANLGVSGLLPDDVAPRTFGCSVAVTRLSRDGTLALALAAAHEHVAPPFGIVALAGRDVREAPREEVIAIIRRACEAGGSFELTLMVSDTAAVSSPQDSMGSASPMSPEPQQMQSPPPPPPLLPPPPLPQPSSLLPPPSQPPPPMLLPPPSTPPPLPQSMLSPPPPPAPSLQAPKQPHIEDHTGSSSDEDERVAQRGAGAGSSPLRRARAPGGRLGGGAALQLPPAAAAHSASSSSSSAAAAADPERAARARRCVAFLLRCGGLKTEKRTGWVHAGVALPESVADHSHRAALIALVAARHAEGAPDARHAALVALVHDLAESLTGDIVPEAQQRARERAGAADVSGASSAGVAAGGACAAGAAAGGAGAGGRIVGKAEKAALEAAAMAALRAELSPHADEDACGALWREYEAHATPAARLVKDADKLEMLLQALEYERAQPALDLSQFYEARARIAGAEAAAMADEVLRLRAEMLEARAAAKAQARARRAQEAGPLALLAPLAGAAERLRLQLLPAPLLAVPAGALPALAAAGAACFLVGALSAIALRPRR